MSHRKIHLIWLGEDPAGLATAAEGHWHEMAPGHETLLHRDASALLPEWKDAWQLATNLSMQSDLLRWSLLLTQGGWYFDCDIRSRLALDQIESECRVDPSRCFITLFGSLFSTPASDILACGPTWPGRDAVIDYVRSQRDPANIHNWTFAGHMLTPFYREHPEWFTVAPPDRYSLMAAPKNQLVFTRAGQADLHTRTQEEQNACIAICHGCKHCTPPYGYCELLSGCHQGPRHLKMLQLGDCPKKKWPARGGSPKDSAPTVSPNNTNVANPHPDRATPAEQERRKAICLSCEDWTQETPAGCRRMKECDRRDSWLMEARWRTANATCMRTCSHLPNKWSEQAILSTNVVKEPNMPLFPNN